ncbi:MAG: pantoate--beta-alanine ligase [Bacteroidota bacterium]
MFLAQTTTALQQFLTPFRQKDKTIGFVPTMGALHEGHLSLIRQSKEQCDVTVCSIFVNPTQFNDASDLEKYPRTVAEDIKLLTSISTDVLLLPSVNEVYPPGLDTQLSLELGALDQVMEGAFRPGHFTGMAQVVKRLLDMVQPHQLLMGQKDFQQASIVRSMLQQLHIPVELVVCPIVREADGLAMSSRNRRLPPEDRQRATLLHEVLSLAAHQMGKVPPAEIQQNALQRLQIPGFKPEYFDIVDGNTLLPIKNFEETDFVVACTAVWVGAIRLIDNMILKQAQALSPA